MHSHSINLPGYEVVEILGQGGFATVYRARQLAVGREVALKVDGRVLAADRDRQRFLREVTSAGRLSGHPHVVALYDAGVLPDGRPYMVMELCPGGSLGERLRDKGPFAVAEARDIGVRLADALAAAHEAGVLHRDIKPGNVMINQYGGVALADFGLAAMPRPGEELSVTREALTPAFAPPEAFRMAEPTPAGDVYSLAATVYALLHGRPPHFPADGDLGIYELIARHSTPVPDIPGVSPALCGVLRHALAADPADRRPSAAALRDALAALDLTAPADPAPAPQDHVPAGFGPPPTAFGPAPTPLAEASVPGAAAGGATEAAAGQNHLPAPPPRGNHPSAPPSALPSGTPTVPSAASGGARPNGGRPHTRWTILVGLVAAAVVGIMGVLVHDGDGSRAKNPGAGPSTEAPSSPDGRNSAKPARAPRFGVPTTTEDCAAAEEDGLGGRCTTTAECWGGMVVTTGVVTVNRSDCLVAHPWETFAIAPLPKDGQTYDQRELAAHPDVRRLCSREVLTSSRRGGARDIAPAAWTVDVLPPTESQYADGLRIYRCVATVTGEQSTTAHFRPRS